MIPANVMLSIEGVPDGMSEQDIINAFHTHLDGALLTIQPGDDGAVRLHVHTVEMRR